MISNSGLLQTRLTKIPGPALDASGDMPGAEGIVSFEYSMNADFSNATRTDWQIVSHEHDSIARVRVENLQPSTKYFYRVWIGNDAATAQPGPTRSFKTLPDTDVRTNISFCMGSCMNYNTFVNGVANGGGPTYRTHRVGKDLQLWFTEGRDYRSPNNMPDGPEKSLWGEQQKKWLMNSLKQSDATWEIIISPTPMVGPDDKSKKDNHANLGGFRHEADSFFQWVNDSNLENLFIFCGDRHWQYHSIHPSGVEEFGCGALNDENSRRGAPPGSPRGTDPEGLIAQPYTYPEPTGGFLHVNVSPDSNVEAPGSTLTIR